MKVTIIKSESEKSWYHNLIGSEIEIDGNMRTPQCKKEKCFAVRQPNGGIGWLPVSCIDPYPDRNKEKKDSAIKSVKKPNRKRKE